MRCLLEVSQGVAFREHFVGNGTRGPDVPPPNTGSRRQARAILCKLNSGRRRPGWLPCRGSRVHPLEHTQFGEAPGPASDRVPALSPCGYFFGGAVCTHTLPGTVPRIPVRERLDETRPIPGERSRYERPQPLRTRQKRLARRHFGPSTRSLRPAGSSNRPRSPPPSGFPRRRGCSRTRRSGVAATHRPG